MPTGCLVCNSRQLIIIAGWPIVKFFFGVAALGSSWLRFIATSGRRWRAVGLGRRVRGIGFWTTVLEPTERLRCDQTVWRKLARGLGR